MKYIVWSSANSCRSITRNIFLHVECHIFHREWEWNLYYCQPAKGSYFVNIWEEHQCKSVNIQFYIPFIRVILSLSEYWEAAQFLHREFQNVWTICRACQDSVNIKKETLFVQTGGNQQTKSKCFSRSSKRLPYQQHSMLFLLHSQEVTFVWSSGFQFHTWDQDCVPPSLSLVV